MRDQGFVEGEVCEGRGEFAEVDEDGGGFAAEEGEGLQVGGGGEEEGAEEVVRDAVADDGEVAKAEARGGAVCRGELAPVKG